MGMLATLLMAPGYKTSDMAMATTWALLVKKNGVYTKMSKVLRLGGRR